MSADMAIVGLQGGVGIGILGFFAFILLVILARSARIVSQAAGRPSRPLYREWALAP